MAQVLKNEQKNKIVEAAKDEFLENGIANSSMRAIAKKAKTPVGNIYRYFQNKQELATEVLSPLLTKLNEYDFKLLPDITLLNKETIRNHLVAWGDNIVELQSNFPIEMNIVVNDKQINHDYQNELISLITTITSSAKQEAAYDNERIQIISKMIAKSIFAGIQEAVSLKYTSNISKENFKLIMRNFMEGTLSMLERVLE